MTSSIEQKKYEADRKAYFKDLREAEAKALDYWKETSIITNRLMLAASLAKNYYEDEENRRDYYFLPAIPEQQTKEINWQVARLHALVKVFEGAVWFLGGLQAQVVGTSQRGLSGKADGWMVLVWSCAGRCLLTFKDNTTMTGEETITLITSDDEKPFTRLEWGNESMGPMGIQGIECTEETGRKLLEQAIKHFPELVPDDKVTIG